MTVLAVVGARPQFIKLAPLVHTFGTYFPGGQLRILHTGQHFDANMSAVFFTELDLPVPDYQLGIHSLPHPTMTGRMLEEIGTIIQKERPHWVLVFGDTNSTLAGALAAKQCGVRVAHVEAGLRSHRPFMPEEINRVLTDRISDVLFCPTAEAMHQLQTEGYGNRNVILRTVGDIMLDAVRHYAERAAPPANFTTRAPFVLTTVHRAANTDDADRLSAIVHQLRSLARTRRVVWPLHPRTARRCETLGIELTGLEILPPQPYLAMQWLLAHCTYVITDSGGLQKEAFFHRKYCLVLRQRTEWVELVDLGASRLVEPAGIERLSQTIPSFPSGSTATPYGEGRAASAIWRTLAEAVSTRHHGE